jgi:phosphate starvation-inducible PhoH-like protein
MTAPNRVRKNEIRYNIVLSEEQKEAKRLILENQIVVITGDPGTGKTLVSAQIALDFLNKKQIEQVLITRPTVVVGDDMGFIPGNLAKKLSPYLQSIVDNLNKLTDGETISKLISDEKIIGHPIQFIRGITVDDVLIVNESQNTSRDEMKAILTRLGKTGKIIIDGDINQKDSKHKYSGLKYVLDLMDKGMDEIKHIHLIENHRSELVKKLLEIDAIL